jgi:hypothetical protein
MAVVLPLPNVATGSSAQSDVPEVPAELLQDRRHLTADRISFCIDVPAKMGDFGIRRTLFRAVRFTAVLLAALLAAAAPAYAQFGATNASRVAALHLPKIQRDGVILYYSPGARDEAEFYANEAAAAVAWYHRTLPWKGSIAMAVLDPADFRIATPIPYPSPHAEPLTGFIIIADHATSHPGFDLWDIDDRSINAAWLFHEMGHVIANDLGIGSANLWINELIASVIMAGYVRAERPQFAGFQSGMPPRFAQANHFTTLEEFDTLYFAMGQLDYLWFHFHIARIADYLVSGPDALATVVEALLHQFPALPRRAPETVAQTLERLERVRPGVGALAAGLI